MSRRLTALSLTLALLLAGCGTTAPAETAPPAEVSQPVEETAIRWESLEPEGKLALDYAQQFTVDCYPEGYRLISMGDGSRYLVVPEDTPVPQGLEEGVVVLQQPLESIYLVSTAAMDFFRALEGIGNISLAGTDRDGWYIQEAVDAMDRGSMTYAGKYNTPDYELILSRKCDLAIENTMIYHNPEVKEELESLGIPVLVERSSYESHPLGRMEWIKFYGVLLGKEDEAEELFRDITDNLTPVLNQESTGKTVAFFYITSNGAANVRKPGDYVARAIALAGGEYVFSHLASEEENALATMNMQMESFYAGARDADILIYNSTIDGELQTMEQLLDKSGLLADFKAVQEGNVWCLEKNLFQESLGLGDLMVDMNTIFNDPTVGDEELTYLHRLG